MAWEIGLMTGSTGLMTVLLKKEGPEFIFGFLYYYSKI